MEKLLNLGYLLPLQMRNHLKTAYLKLKLKAGIEAPVEISLRNSELDLHPKSRIMRGCSIRGKLSLGRYSQLGRGTEVRGSVEIGDFCAVARNAVFQSHNHDHSRLTVQNRLHAEILDISPESEGSSIEVGNDVWIGTRAVILPGVEIGHGAVVGAGAVVTRDIEPYEIVGSVPAENIGWRFDQETRERLLELEWWNWSEEEIRKQEELFTADIASNPEILE